LAFEIPMTMRATRAVVVALILIVVAGVVAWVFLKTTDVPQEPPATRVPVKAPAALSQSAPVPASDNHPTTVAPSPEPAALTGLDAHSLATCHGELLRKKGIESLMACEKTPVDDHAAQSYCRGYQGELILRLQKAAADAASCPPELAAATNYYRSMRALAVGGDIPAQRCFIQGYFGTASKEDPDSWITADQQKEYIELTRRFIDAAFERGDWRVVRWLGRTRTDIADGLLFQAYPIGIDNLDTLYRMNYLLVLGNHPDGRQSREARRLTDFWKKNQKLTASEIADAESWAHDMYSQHFNGSQEGASSDDAGLCEIRWGA